MQAADGLETGRRVEVEWEAYTERDGTLANINGAYCEGDDKPLMATMFGDGLKV